jgi:tetratricopeptide (TPR) repeat protein
MAAPEKKWVPPAVVATLPHQPVMGMWGSDTAQWMKPKDLPEYPVEKVLDLKDPDWLQFGGSVTPDFNDPYALPKALQEDTLKLWRPEPLRPARIPKKAASLSRLGTSSPSACEKDLRRLQPPSSTAAAQPSKAPSQPEAYTEENLRNTFQRFGVEAKGQVSASELRALLGDDFEGVEVLEELIEDAGGSNEGRLSAEDFLSYLQQHDGDQEPEPKAEAPAALASAMATSASSPAPVAGGQAPVWSKSSPGSTAMTLASTTADTFGSRTFNSMAATASTWSDTVRPKLNPLDCSMRSASQPQLQVKPTTPYEDPTTSLYARSMVQLKQQEYGASIATLEKALSADPRYGPVWRQRGAMKARNDDYDGVIADCNEALRLDASHASTWARRAEAKFQKDDLQGAIRDCDEALFRDCRIHRAWNIRGVAKFKLGDVIGSIRDCSEAKRIDPTIPEYWTRTAAGKVLVEDFKRALEDCNEAIRLDVHHLPGWIQRAEARNAIGEYQGALDDCNEALRLRPNCVPAFAHRGHAKMHLEDFAGALVDCNRAIALNPKFAQAWCTRGEARYAHGDFREALKDFDQAIAVEPNHSRSWWYRGKTLLYYSGGSSTKWKPSAERYVAARKDSAQAFYLEPRNEDARLNIDLATTAARNVSAWRLPIVRRGVQGELKQRERLRRQCEGRPGTSSTRPGTSSTTSGRPGSQGGSRPASRGVS